MGKDGHDDKDGKENNPTLRPLTATMAVVVLLAFGLVVLHMFQISTAEEKVWTRSAYLFEGIEAIAFAAAGFLFGREVHRQQAAKAERRADAAQERADNEGQRAAGASAGLQSIVNLVRTKETLLDTRGQPFAATGPTNVLSKADLQEIAQVAEGALRDASAKAGKQ